MFRANADDGEREASGEDAEIRYAATSTRGLHYDVNEDAFAAFLEARTFVVVDGTGGRRPAGDLAALVASAFAPVEGGPPIDPLAAAVDRAFGALADVEDRGGGVALAAARVGPSWFSYAHVGDARVYRVRGEALQRLTLDHLLVFDLVLDLPRGDARVEDALRDHRTVITRALVAGGGDEPPPVDVGYARRRDGDVLLLCTGGVGAALEAEAIREAFVPHRKDLPLAVSRVVEAAERSGPHENLTVLAVEVKARR